MRITKYLIFQHIMAEIHSVVLPFPVPLPSASNVCSAITEPNPKRGKVSTQKPKRFQPHEDAAIAKHVAEHGA